MKQNPSETVSLGYASALSALVHFGYLQGLDLLTTVAFLLSGVKEGNPLVRVAMAATGDAVSGLIFVKLVAISLGLFCWWTNRGRLLERINLLYALLVAWNLLALIVGLSQSPR